jgi:hypothetical protein
LKIHGMNKIGNKIILSISEFGINDIHVTVIALKPTKLDTSKMDWSKRKSRPAIGTFKRYASMVKTYTFKDLSTGEVSTINATPNHPFYVQNKHKFVPIEDVAPSDQLVSAIGKKVRLICEGGKSSYCGDLYNKDGKPVVVYNLEVYKDHVYFVGESSMIVHNYCFPNRIETTDTYARKFHGSINILKNQKKIITTLYHETLESIKISTTGLVDGYSEYIAPDRLATYRESSKAEASKAMQNFRLAREQTYNLMAECEFGNCGEQSAFITNKLGNSGLISHQYRLDGVDHRVSIVFSSHNDNLIPTYIVDPWRGVIEKFSPSMQFYKGDVFIKTNPATY